MATFLNFPGQHPPTTLARYEKEFSAHDKGICRYKLQLIISNLEEAQTTTYLHFPFHHPPTILA